MNAAGKYVLVTASNGGPSQSPSGLYLAPSADQAQVVSGEVVSVGPDVTTGIRVGNRVHFNKFTATKVTVGGVDFWAVLSEQILVIE